jgi:hypothetical protein
MKRIYLWLSLLFTARLIAADPAVAVLDGNILCVRTARVSENFNAQIQPLWPTNRIAGVVLDLRFAGGDSSPADNFLLDKKTRLVLLVNSQTRGAALELAGKLRAAGRAVIIGSTNAVGALSADILVNATVEAEKKFQSDPFAAGASTNAASPLAKADLVPYVDHMSEAELVHRKIKDGEDMDEADLTPRAALPPVIRDPALARAVDLLKVLAVLKPLRG